MKRILMFPLIVLSMPALAENYATCLLNNLDGVQNQVAAVSAIRLCASAHPAGMNGVEWGAGRGWFAKYDSPEECSLKSTRSMRNKTGALHARGACKRLYGSKPDLFDELGIHPQRRP